MPYLYFIRFDLDTDKPTHCYVCAVGHASTISDLYGQTMRWERIVTSAHHCIEAVRWAWRVPTYAKSQRLESFIAGAELFVSDDGAAPAQTSTADGTDNCRWFSAGDVPEFYKMKKMMEPAKCITSHRHYIQYDHDIHDETAELYDDGENSY